MWYCQNQQPNACQQFENEVVPQWWYCSSCQYRIARHSSVNSLTWTLAETLLSLLLIANIIIWNLFSSLEINETHCCSLSSWRFRYPQWHGIGLHKNRKVFAHCTYVYTSTEVSVTATCVYFVRCVAGCHVKLASRLGASFVYTIQPCTSLQCHFTQNHIGRVQVCLAVTCHLHFWQNDRDLLCATAVHTGNACDFVVVVPLCYMHLCVHTHWGFLHIHIHLTWHGGDTRIHKYRYLHIHTNETYMLLRLMKLNVVNCRPKTGTRRAWWRFT